MGSRRCHTYGIIGLTLLTLPFVAAAQLPGRDTVPLSTPWTASANSAAIPLPLYPRPQLQRKEWLNLNGAWDYAGGKDLPDPVAADNPISFGKAPARIVVP